MLWMPGTYSTFFPISVARPIASSTAFRPAMRRMKICFPDLAMVIETRRMARKRIEAMKEFVRSFRNQLSREATGSLTRGAPVAASLDTLSDGALAGTTVRIS